MAMGKKLQIYTHLREQNTLSNHWSQDPRVCWEW